MTFKLVEMKENVGEKRFFFICESKDTSMRNWVGMVEFRGRDFSITSFRKKQTLEEQLSEDELQGDVLS